MDPFVYVIPSVIGAAKLKKVISDKFDYQVSVEKGEKSVVTLIDTFEDELLKASKILFQDETKLSLLDLNSGRIVEQPTAGKWRFAADLDGGPVGDVLHDISKLRAFLPVAKVEVRQDRGLLLDDEDKTRARFQNFVIFGRKKSISLGLTVYLRGYRKAHSDLVQGVGRLGGVVASECSTIYKSLGYRKLDYNSKPSLPLSAKGPAKETAVTIIKTFITIARSNEAGVIADYDTEFLHDYRVSFRKVRSVLSLFKGVYGQDVTNRLKEDFANLMRDTNRLRDLDVYLLERDKYFRLVPETSHEGLVILFSYLERERKKELKKVKKILKSRLYNNNLQELQRLFDEGETLKDGPKAKQRSIEFGSRLILKRYKQVCRIAGTIHADTPDEVVHELRISCKKLRYLMEFFTPLFDAAKIKSLIKALKVLQDNLGQFNDYSVQQSFLRQIVTTSLPSFNKHEIVVTESIGALTAMLHRLQLKERKQVMKNFAAFDGETTRALIRELFQDRGEN